MFYCLYCKQLHSVLIYLLHNVPTGKTFDVLSLSILAHQLSEHDKNYRVQLEKFQLMYPCFVLYYILQCLQHL